MRKRPPYNKIKAFLVEKGIKHKDIAETLNVTPNTISKKLNGLGGDFTLSEVKRLHDDFNVPIEFFFEPNVPKRERKEEVVKGGGTS